MAKTSKPNPIPGSPSSTGQKPPSTGNADLDAAAAGRKRFANPRPQRIDPASGGSRYGKADHPPTRLDEPAKSDGSSFKK
ncbi:MAG: hypothetical protein ACE37F_26125 [Nannocystaceae bacterium]|nr:hypothetical protein [bacterium]